MSTDFADARGAPAPAGGRRPLRWVSTANPFYVVSAALFLGGLRASFEARDGDWQVGALLAGLTAYTLLLAATGWLLVHALRVWDDARTVLLLVVLMFLATSVTFDETVVFAPPLGVLCCVGGLLFAAAVSEGVLRSIRLRLPLGFRVPYYLALGLFFLYPLLLKPFVADPHGEPLMWLLFAFPAAAGVVALTLIPAAHRGPGYVRDTGSPWPWPWPFYPWSLFVFLGVFVPVRANLLCVSFHLLKFAEYDGFIFAPYFLVTFGFAVAVVLVEASPRRAGLVALGVPPVMAVLASIGHSADPVYNEFLGHFRDRLGGTPLFLTVLLSAGFYSYAMLRRVPFAVEGLTFAVAALSVVGPDDLRPDLRSAPALTPLVAVAAVQLLLGLWRHDPWRCLIAAGGVALTAGAACPLWDYGVPVRGLVTYHLTVVCLLALGAAFRRDEFGKMLQFLGTAAVLIASAGALAALAGLPNEPLAWAIGTYPLAMAGLLAVYGWLTGYWLSSAVAVLIAAGWAGAVDVRGYLALRKLVVGLDAITLSLAVFAGAFGISWTKRYRPRPTAVEVPVGPPEG